MFAMYAAAGRHGFAHDALWCNAPPGMHEMLAAAEPDTYYIPPYMGVSGWVGIYLDRVEDEEIESLVAQSYCMVAPKKLAAIVGG
jgi:hypothetical protein